MSNNSESLQNSDGLYPKRVSSICFVQAIYIKISDFFEHFNFLIESNPYNWVKVLDLFDLDNF